MINMFSYGLLLLDAKSVSIVKIDDSPGRLSLNTISIKNNILLLFNTINSWKQKHTHPNEIIWILFLRFQDFLIIKWYLNKICLRYFLFWLQIWIQRLKIPEETCFICQIQTCFLFCGHVLLLNCLHYVLLHQ